MKILIASLSFVLVFSALSRAVPEEIAAATAPIFREISFKPTEAMEQQFIYRWSNSKTVALLRARYHDGAAYIIYRFAFAKNTGAALEMKITGQFKVDISKDGENFEAAADYTEKKGDPLTLDLSRHLSEEGYVYVKVGDATPDDGRGGRIHEIKVSGNLLDKPVARVENVTPVFLPERESLYAKLPPPEKDMVYFPASGASREELILFRTLQGLANREKNQLFVEDGRNLIPELEKRGWIDNITTIADAKTLFERFPRKDAVVYDPEVHASENLAVMIGAMEGLVTAHPDLVAKYGLNVAVDLRGRWEKTIDGYREVYAQYKDQFNRQTLVLNGPQCRTRLYDYAVANKTFTFWITGPLDSEANGADAWAEEEWFERILSQDFPVNIPILGYPELECGGIGENRGVALFSRCAKFLIPSDHMDNMSVFSAYPNARGKIHMPQPTLQQLDPNKVYASLVLSDGDNLCLWNGPHEFMFQYMKQIKQKGPRDFSVSYTMGPSLVDLHPLAASMVSEYLEPQDSIGVAVSGVGYMYMSHYANNFGADREKVVSEFIDMTSAYMEYVGLRWIWAMDYGGPGSQRLQDYAGLKSCVALMGGYGREATEPAQTTEPVGAMTAFHSINLMAPKKGVLLGVRRMIDSGVRPLFLHVFIHNWSFTADQYHELATELKSLGIEVVTPEVLADLYSQSTR